MNKTIFVTKKVQLNDTTTFTIKVEESTVSTNQASLSICHREQISVGSSHSKGRTYLINPSKNALHPDMVKFINKVIEPNQQAMVFGLIHEQIQMYVMQNVSADAVS